MVLHVVRTVNALRAQTAVKVESVQKKSTRQKQQNQEKHNMKNLIAIFVFIMIAGTSQAQFNKAVLQASGLTCSMCSKAVKVALEEVSFVEKVMVDIKKQQYNLTFRQDAVI